MALKLKKTEPKNKPTLPSSVHDLANAAPMTVNPLIKERDAAKILGVSQAYLASDRWYAKKEGTSPKISYIKMKNGAVRYHIDDLNAFISASKVG